MIDSPSPKKTDLPWIRVTSHYFIAAVVVGLDLTIVDSALILARWRASHIDTFLAYCKDKGYKIEYLP